MCFSNDRFSSALNYGFRKTVYRFLKTDPAREDSYTGCRDTERHNILHKTPCVVLWLRYLCYIKITLTLKETTADLQSSVAAN